MSNLEDYDVFVLGSGDGGKLLAWTLASQGKRAAVIERRYLGGTCPNIACLPSKNVIHSAKVASYLRQSEEFGITKKGWKIDMEVVRDRKRRLIDGLKEQGGSSERNVLLKKAFDSGGEDIAHKNVTSHSYKKAFSLTCLASNGVTAAP